jgi:hypothetical protein
MRRILILICVLCYGGLWWRIQGEPNWSDQYLSPPLPVEVVETASGFGRHLAGFGLFVKTSIFMGNSALKTRIDTHAESLAQNLDAATQLYPAFVDPYYFSEASLPHVSRQYARRANQLLDRGIAAHPDNQIIPFFKAFNHFYYLDEPIAAAKIFADLAKRPEAPSLFSSLSTKLMARGGQLSAGRDMMKVMRDSETDEELRERYAAELRNFDKALIVQQALDRYRKEVGAEAPSLFFLVPHYLSSLPQLELGSILVWEPPILKMVYPGHPEDGGGPKRMRGGPHR